MSTGRGLRVLQLYPRALNVYGDRGNAIALARRLVWHGYDVDLLEHNPGDALPSAVDIVIGGGGQDSDQLAILDDVLRIRPWLDSVIDDYTPMLAVCGMYQLLGDYFTTSGGMRTLGAGVLDLWTDAAPGRIVGNVSATSAEFGTILGFENHGGRTTLGNGMRPLARTRTGQGNNGLDRTEGVRYRNVIGTYLHGALLPKNPAIADFLIGAAAVRKYGSFHPDVLDDDLELRARRVASRLRR